MSDIDIAPKHAIDHQLQAIRLGALYGALALAGLIAVHIAMRSPFGALLAIIAALFAYLNFSVAAQNAQSQWIDRTQALSILFGAASGIAVLVQAMA